MAGIYSQGGSAGHRYAGWLETVEAKNFKFGGKVFNGSPSAIYVGSNKVWLAYGLKDAAMRAILGAFGQTDGMAVINATNAYLNQLAASGQAGKDKATALAALINEDPMMVCSLGLEVEGVTMPIRWLKGNASCWIDTGVGTDANTPLDTTFIFTELDNNHCGIMSNGTFEIYYWGTTIEFHCSSTFYLINNAQTNEKYRLKVENGVYTFWRNDVQAGTGNRNLGTQSRKVALFALNRGSASYQTKAMIAECKIGSKHFIPFLHKDGEDEIPCMLDLNAVGVTGAQTIYEKSGGSGSFTIPDISYTPSTP